MASGSYSLIIVSFLGVLALFTLILASSATRLSVNYSNASSKFDSTFGENRNPYPNLTSTAILLSFNGWLTFIWSLSLIVVILVTTSISRGIVRSIVGPFSLGIQAAVLWILFLSGAASLSAKQSDTNCDFYRGFIEVNTCSLSSATQAFAWMSFIILSVLLCLLIFYMITGSDDDSSNASSRFFSQNEIQQQQNRRAEKDFEASTSQFRKKESHFHS